MDKFQGREAPVAIYSMATSSADDAPRGLEFLYDPHRLNVATSRAKAMAVVVASSDLIRVACKTPRQMHLANARRRLRPRWRPSAAEPTSSTRACCWARARTQGRRCWGGRTSWSAPACSQPRMGSRARASCITRSWTPSWPGRAKARAVAQTAFYSHLLAALQGVRPRWMHLALGRGELVPLKVGDYAAYERQARRALGTFIAADPGHNPPTDPYPEPVEHCVICRWDDLCKDRRRRDDDLSLVAGITKDQRRTLKTAGVSTRRGLASLDVLPGGNAAEPAIPGRCPAAGPACRWPARTRAASGTRSWIPNGTWPGPS